MEKQRCEICKEYREEVDNKKGGICRWKSIKEDVKVTVAKDYGTKCESFVISDRYKFDELGYVNDEVPF